MCFVVIRLLVVDGKIVALEKNISVMVDRWKQMTRNGFFSSSKRVVSSLNTKLVLAIGNRNLREEISDRHNLI